MLVSIANREDPDQTAFSEVIKSLIFSEKVGNCLAFFNSMSTFRCWLVGFDPLCLSQQLWSC